MTEFKEKIELKNSKKANDSSTNVKYLSIGKTKIPLTEEEFKFIRAKVDEHVEKHGIAFGFVYNLFLKDEDNEQELTNN
jgi:hypothetical protein